MWSVWNLAESQAQYAASSNRATSVSGPQQTKQCFIIGHSGQLQDRTVFFNIFQLRSHIFTKCLMIFVLRVPVASGCCVAWQPEQNLRIPQQWMSLRKSPNRWEIDQRKRHCQAKFCLFQFQLLRCCQNSWLTVCSEPLSPSGHLHLGKKNPSRSRTWKQFNAAEILDILRQFVNPCDICDILWHLPVLGNLFHTFWKGVQHSKDLVAKFRLHFGLHQLNELLSSSRVKVNGFGWGPPHARSHIRQRWKLWSILVLDMQNHETNWTNMKEQITTPWSNCLEMPEKLQTHIIMLRQPLVEISDSHLGSHLLKTWSIGIGICNLRHLRYEHTLQGPWPSAVRAFIMPEHFFCEWYWSPIISLSCFSDLQYWTKYAICTAVPTLTQRIHLGDHNFSLRANGKQTNTVKYK